MTTAMSPAAPAEAQAAATERRQYRPALREALAEADLAPEVVRSLMGAYAVWFASTDGMLVAVQHALEREVAGRRREELARIWCQQYM